MDSKRTVLRLSGILAFTAAAVVSTGLSASAVSAQPSTPAVSVNPSSGLADGQMVEVTVRGFPPRANLQVVVIECTLDHGFACDRPNAEIATLDGNGGVTIKMPLHRIFDDGSGPVDCNTSPRGCFVEAADFDGNEPRAKVTFR